MHLCLSFSFLLNLLWRQCYGYTGAQGAQSLSGTCMPHKARKRHCQMKRISCAGMWPCMTTGDIPRHAPGMLGTCLGNLGNPSFPCLDKCTPGLQSSELNTSVWLAGWSYTWSWNCYGSTKVMSVSTLSPKTLVAENPQAADVWRWKK